LEVEVKPKTHQLLAFLLLLAALFNVQLAHAQQPVVHAILFYSPTCPHCQKVINEDLPPLVQKYGDQVDIIGIDVTTEVGQNLYQSARIRFKVPDARLGVPTLIVGDTVLVGALEIPQSFPGLVEAGLAAGGVDYPDIPGLREIMAGQPQPQTGQTAPQESQPAPVKISPIDRFMQDPIANTVAVIVLIGMVGSVIAVGYSYVQGEKSKFLHFPKWAIPVLALLGMGVAAYLSYVEITGSEAVCGPVGNCNSVQESPYAYLFGVIPIGAMGLVGYAVILAAWLFREYGPKSWGKFFSLAIWGMAWFGILFSIYLTFLEPFVIGATCAWCIASAILMTLTFLAATEPAMQAMHVDEEEFDYEDELESGEDNPDEGDIPEFKRTPAH
jgi:uncharacterized membrane protein/thiol-disulfide isomerase/thioredoxin